MRDGAECFLIRGSPANRVLLGLKKAGFGAGKYAGFGGKIEAGETVSAAAIRELEEEAGVKVLERDLQPAGHLRFLFPARPSWSQVVHVFLVTTWEGKPAENSEMVPAWFAMDGIPFGRMWQDAAHWLPLILAGERIRGTFTYREDCETIDEFQIRVWNPDASKSCEHRDVRSSGL